MIDQEDSYDSICALLPPENRERFLKYVARIRTFHADDEILMLVETCGYFTLLAGQLPRQVIAASERLAGAARELDTQVKRDAATVLKETLAVQGTQIATVKKSADDFLSRAQELIETLKTERQGMIRDRRDIATNQETIKSQIAVMQKSLVDLELREQNLTWGTWAMIFVAGCFFAGIFAKIFHF